MTQYEMLLEAKMQLKSPPKAQIVIDQRKHIQGKIQALHFGH